MTEFYFGKDCTFCQSRIGSTHCLLPYQLVISYNPPKDITSKVIDITEIHMRYGIEALNYNSQSLEWIRERSNSMSSAARSHVTSQDSRLWSEQMSEIDRTQSPDNGGIPLTGIPTQTDRNQQISMTKSMTPESKGKTLAEIVHDELTISKKIVQHQVDEPKTVSPRSEQSSPAKTIKQQDVVVKAKSNDKIKFEMTREARNHIISDAVLVAKVAFNLHSAERGWITVNALKESIIYESNLRSKLSVKYHPTSDKRLDGNIALAKAIVATHDNRSIQSWTSGQAATHGPYCLLSRSFLSINDDEHSDSSLFDELIKCFSATINILHENTTDGKNISEAIKFTLVKDNYPNAYEWMLNQMKYIGIQSIPKSMTRSMSTDKGKNKRVSSPYPPIDERLLDFINIRLQVIVNKNIENAKDEVPRMPDETKLTRFFFKLASEFLRRNKGWKNENSFTSPQHLTKLEEQTGLKTEPSEMFMTFSILRNIINEFRVAFKEKYPKTERPEPSIGSNEDIK